MKNMADKQKAVLKKALFASFRTVFAVVNSYRNSKKRGLRLVRPFSSQAATHRQNTQKTTEDPISGILRFSGAVMLQPLFRFPETESDFFLYCVRTQVFLCRHSYEPVDLHAGIHFQTANNVVKTPSFVPACWINHRRQTAWKIALSFIRVCTSSVRKQGPLPIIAIALPSNRGPFLRSAGWFPGMLRRSFRWDPPGPNPPAIDRAGRGTGRYSPW